MNLPLNAFERAQHIRCPRCGAGPQQGCVDLNGNAIRGQHIERINAAQQSPGAR
jgi:hypothetical protein